MDAMRSIGVVRRTLGLNSYTEGPKQLTMLASHCFSRVRVRDSQVHRHPWIILCGSMSKSHRPRRRAAELMPYVQQWL